MSCLDKAYSDQLMIIEKLEEPKTENKNDDAFIKYIRSSKLNPRLLSIGGLFTEL
jgi:hypothetical protein